jgi:hypothetical protein
MGMNDLIEQTIYHLAEIRGEVATLPPEEALDRILSAPEPVALVHSFPEQDLYLLVHDIGIADALPILKLASNRQWEYFFDAEVWERDRIDLNAVTRWAHLFLTTDPSRMTRWVSYEKIIFFEYYLYKNIRVVVREHDQDPAELGDDFFTFDDVFYIRILDDPMASTGVAEDAGQKGAKDDEERRWVLTQMLKRLAEEDSVRFNQILLEAMHVITTEIEEERFRQRNIRMAEKGFLPFDEAIAVYQPLSPEDVKTQLLAREYRPPVDSNLPVARLAVRLGDDQSPVIRALEVFDTDAHRLQAEVELVGLSNRLIVADHKPVREPADLRYTVQKACGYISIGLTGLAAEDGDPAPDARKSAAMMVQYSLPTLFRLGFGYALRLKWRADRWHPKSWFRRQGLALTFWDETWMGVLGGLLIKKPLCFDKNLTDQHYREFAAMDEIIESGKALDRIIALDRFFADLDIDPQNSSDTFLTYKNLLLSLWARDCLGLSPTVEAIELSAFRSFYADHLFSLRPSGRPEGPVSIRLNAKQSFLKWLIDQSGLTENEIMSRVGVTLDDLFAEVESELGNVRPAHIDPRFVSLFILR